MCGATWQFTLQPSHWPGVYCRGVCCIYPPNSFDSNADAPLNAPDEPAPPPSVQVSPSAVAKIRDALLQAGDHAWQPLSLEPFSTGAANDEVNEALQQMLSPGSFRVRVRWFRKGEGSRSR